jgi:thiamine-monophosphate kinase
LVTAERQLIEGIRRAAAKTASPWVKLGIGDDAALLQVPAGFELLVTTDLCVEDIHFRREWHPAKSVGHRCLARGLSDIAAMGGEPVACFLSLALPPKLPQRWADNFMAGLLQLGRRFRTPLAGGDTSTAAKITADIIVLGKVPAEKALLRSKARSGDRIWVTGELGGSAATLKQLYSGGKISPTVSNRHFYPVPRLEVGRWLQKNNLATAMIDISDGLSVDLAHICEESAVDGVINLDAIPTAKTADLSLALHGGEDYELLFTAPKSATLPKRIAGVLITEIGAIRPCGDRRASVKSKDAAGNLRLLRPEGWEHFSKI